MKQKLLPLCVALLALVLCNTPLFAEDFAVDGIYYDITSSTDKTVAVTFRGDYSHSYSNEYSGAVTIPESVTYSGSTYSVTSIGKSAFEDCYSLTSVVIGNSVTSIGNDAFSGCSSLTSVEIPNSVTSIGFEAFSGCSSMTSVEIGNSVTIIGEWAFCGCSSLTSVEIPNSVTTIEHFAFQYCSSLTSVEIPNSVTEIMANAFYECDRLKTATVGCSWKTNPLYEFDKKVTVNATLHSYENGICTVCGDKENIELVEGTNFANELQREAVQVTYNRTLPNLEWNALYLPVEIPVAALSENYDLAYFNNMHAYDRNNDGTVDEMDMEIFLIKEGTLNANYPYFIRAKNEGAKKLQLVLKNVLLHPSEETSLTCSSVFMNFTLTGIYTRHMVEDLPGCYAITGSGAWAPIAVAVGSYLDPFRLYLKITDRDGTPVKMDQALQTIRIRVHGEDGTTDIEEHCINGQQSTTIYDLQGRCVVNPAKGIYIVNGKKVMIK